MWFGYEFKVTKRSFFVNVDAKNVGTRIVKNHPESGQISNVDICSLPSQVRDANNRLKWCSNRPNLRMKVENLRMKVEKKLN